MSGTSLDGVDGAMILTDGEKIIDFGASFFRPYDEREVVILRDALGLWPNEDPTRLLLAETVVENAHIEVINHFPTADLIGFHGQTLVHDPKRGRTFQIGDGAVLAKKCQKKVVWDFRTTDMLAGGQGAPLAPFFHFACAKQLGQTKSLAFVNLGGVGNVTWLDPSKDNPVDKGAILAFDTGPGNAPLNDLVSARLNIGFDIDGKQALDGRVDIKALECFLNDEYFLRIPPKSLDRNSFPEIQNLVSNLSTPDAAASLTAMTTASIYAAQMYFPSDPTRWLICGGGRKNPAMMTGLIESMAANVSTCEAVGLDGDMLEAQAFGYLAVRVIRGLPTSSPTTTGCKTPCCGGIISDF